MIILTCKYCKNTNLVGRADGIIYCPDCDRELRLYETEFAVTTNLPERKEHTEDEVNPPAPV
jgi:uncharacterized Zn finger protein (UPF0148 family)